MRAGGICRCEGKMYDTRSATYLLIAANPTISSYGSRNELPSASPQGAPVVEPRRVGAVVELEQCGESGEIFWLTVRGSRGAWNDSSFFLARCSRNPRAPAEVPDVVVEMVGTCAADACRVKAVVMVPVCWRCIVMCSLRRAPTSPAGTNNVTRRLQSHANSSINRKQYIRSVLISE